MNTRYRIIGVLLLISLAWPVYGGIGTQAVAGTQFGTVAQQVATLTSVPGTCAVNGAGGAQFTKIQAAVDDVSCATVNVAAGTYFENITITRNVNVVGRGKVIVDGNNVGRVFYVYPGEVLLEGLTIQNGVARPNDPIGNFGGGVVNGGFLMIRNSTIISNTALRSSVNDVSPSTVSGSGGGIYNNNQLILINSTVANNRAEAGQNGGGVSLGAAGIYNNNAMTIQNSTIANNGGSNVFDGYQIASPNRSATVIRDSIIIGSSSKDNCLSPISLNFSNNLDSDGTCGVSPATDPKLDPLGLKDNGGSTQTIALQSNSPAIDAANAANCPATDQRGVARPQGAGCDIGAYELEGTPANTPTPTSTSLPPTPIGSSNVCTGSGVPAGWLIQQEGGGSRAGGSFICTGPGGSINHFVNQVQYDGYLPITGDRELTAQLVSIDLGGVTSLFYSEGHFGPGTSVPLAPSPAISNAKWARIRIVGNMALPFASLDGINWVALPTVALPNAPSALNPGRLGMRLSSNAPTGVALAVWNAWANTPPTSATPTPTPTATPAPLETKRLIVNVQTKDYAPLEGWEIKIYDTSIGERLVQTATTDSNGQVLTYIPAGRYKICETVKEGYKVVYPNHACYWQTLTASSDFDLILLYLNDFVVAPPPSPTPSTCTSLNRNAWRASSSYGGNTALAINANLATFWNNGITRQGQGQWFSVDLGAQKTFNGITLDNASDPSNYPRKIGVYVSTDGGIFTKVGEVTPSGAVSTFSFAKRTARYVSVEILQSNFTASWSISDFDVCSGGAVVAAQNNAAQGIGTSYVLNAQGFVPLTRQTFLPIVFR